MAQEPSMMVAQTPPRDYGAERAILGDSAQS